MRFTVNRESLRKTLAFVSNALPTRTTQPALNNVHIAAGDTIARLQCTDQEIAVSQGLSADVQSPGAVCVDPKRLQAGIANMLADDVTLSLEGDRLSVRGNPREKITLPICDPDVFPLMPARSRSGDLRVRAEPLQKHFKRSIGAADKHDTGARWSVSAVCLEQAGDSLNILATDTRMLSCATIAGIECDTKIQSLVPLKAASAIERMLSQCDPDDEIIVDCTATVIDVAAGPKRVYSRLVEGRFPPYRDIFPKAVRHTLTLPIEDLRRAARVAKSVATDDVQRAELIFANKELRVVGKGDGESEVVLSIDAKFEMTLAIDPQYLLSLFNGMDGEVEIDLVDPEKPVVFHVGDDWKGLLMPLAG